MVRVAGDPSLWQDNGLRCLKANLVCGRVKPVTSLPDITNLNNKIKNYYINLIY